MPYEIEHPMVTNINRHGYPEKEIYIQDEERYEEE